MRLRAAWLATRWVFGKLPFNWRCMYAMYKQELRGERGKRE